MARSRIIIASLGLLASLAGAGAEETDQPLVFTVHPSTPPVGPAGETLDEKLARRERGLRFICLGCVRADGHVDTAPFYPIRTLNAPQLTAALANEERSGDIGPDGGAREGFGRVQAGPPSPDQTIRSPGQ